MPSLWDGWTYNGVAHPTDTAPVNLGMEWWPDVDGSVSALRLYCASDLNSDTRTMRLYRVADQALLAEASLICVPGAGWTNASITPVNVYANTHYMVAVFNPGNAAAYEYARTLDTFGTQIDNGHLHAAATNDFYEYAASPTYPASGPSLSANYWVDVVFNLLTGSGPWPTAFMGRFDVLDAI